jgi:hypothetical protein
MAGASEPPEGKFAISMNREKILMIVSYAKRKIAN